MGKCEEDLPRIAVGPWHTVYRMFLPVAGTGSGCEIPNRNFKPMSSPYVIPPSGVSDYPIKPLPDRRPVDDSLHLAVALLGFLERRGSPIQSSRRLRGPPPEPWSAAPSPIPSSRALACRCHLRSLGELGPREPVKGERCVANLGCQQQWLSYHGPSPRSPASQTFAGQRHVPVSHSFGCTTPIGCLSVDQSTVAIAPTAAAEPAKTDPAAA
ncbi:hypothetical protein S40285_10038 [Stachybotrys chlorohalonatus IBT 40285]|uniref:Uncharacterized protein n=1 Tax=Stachybotrys chlorohalonatus (strain IBT 40285) TaxID=1283841 RepID=A0A084QDC5_STAC4|nr:hypothetical protein S40285_10038 [Stachybotrys chlorohalonata IBT 40285]